jgi:hypothetical protein
MQTFLPSTNFAWAAQMLDSKRLNKQILEGYQILNVLSGQSPTGGWRNHPAVLMWKNHEGALLKYLDYMIIEAKQRNIKTDKNESNIQQLFKKVGKNWNISMPEWFDNDLISMRIITTHRASLFNKDPMYYAKFQYATLSAYNIPCCPDKKEPCKYYWPTHNTRNSSQVG